MNRVLRKISPWSLAAIAVWPLAYLLDLYLDAYFYSILVLAGINVILAASLNLVSGCTGQFSMGHAGFMSVGAYVSAFLSIAFRQYGFEGPFAFLIALFAGSIAAAFAGFLVGLPSLRLKGDYLAIVTLGFGEIIRVVILNLDAVGGARGLPNIPAESNLGWVLFWMVVTLYLLTQLLKSRHGRSFLAVREDEIAAEAMGVHTTRAKVQSFVIGAFFAGLAGGLFAHYLRYINPQTFDFNRSFEVIIMVVLGGMGNLWGSAAAAVFLTVVREALRPLQEWTQIDFRMILYSLLLISLMLFKHRGGRKRGQIRT